MREFKSLKPEGLPEEFDAETHGEQPIIKIEETKNRIVLSYTFPGFYLAEDKRDLKGKKLNFKQVNIAATGYLAESGKPLLPSFGRYVNIPPGYEYNLTVKKSKPIQFDEIDVLPAQEKLIDKTNDEHVFEFDSEFYAKDVLYPKEIVEISGPLRIDDYNALLLHVRPIQYNPAKKKLIGYSNITVIIDIKDKKTKEPMPAVSTPSFDREAFGNLFLNPSRKISENLEINPEIITLRLKPPEFLIIYHDNFKAAAEKLAKWKNMRGLRTEIVPISAIGNTMPLIKQYIRNKRKGLSLLRYVLLFGDVDLIASETITNSPWGNNITDYYYSTEVDSTSPTTYVLPWLSIGRIPMRTDAEANLVVDQIIAYEKNPPADSSYYQRMTTAAFFQDDNMDGRDDRGFLKTMEDIRSYMLSLGYDVDRVNVSNNPNLQYYYDGTPIPPDVKTSIVTPNTATNMLINATTEGQLIIGHRDHGDTPGWAHPPFTTTNLDSVTGEMPTIFYSINCLTGCFDLPVPTESFAEKNLRIKGTAPSLIAATRVSHTWLNNDLIKGLFDATFGGLIPTFPGGTVSYPIKNPRLGDILNYAKSYLPVKMSGSSEYIKDHFEIYHVIGDPTIEIWKSLPLPVSITAKLTIRGLAIRLSSCPTGCILTVWYGEKMLKRLEPSSTNMIISLSGMTMPTRLQPIYVCFWATGYRFARVKATTFLLS